MSVGESILFEGVSKFYGEVLGVHGLDLEIGPGITALVGPNGSGKSTLMNLMTGLLRPSRGRIRVHGVEPSDPVRLFREVGYCTQFDAFPRAPTAGRLLAETLRLHGYPAPEAEERAVRTLARVGLTAAGGRRPAAYSKGMRQRLKLALAIAHRPPILVLDEPLDGLDPLARSELIDLFRELAAAGRTLVVSSHILHEVDVIADRVVLLNQGYLVAEGDIPEVRSEMVHHPLTVAVRCPRPEQLASRLFATRLVVEATLHDDGGGLSVRTRDADAFHQSLAELVRDGEVEVEAVAPADQDAFALYHYLVGGGGEGVE